MHQAFFAESSKHFLKNIPRHQPRVAVRRVAILETLRVERVVTVGHGMLNVVATSQSLDAKDIIEVQALVTRNSVGCKAEIDNFGQRQK